MKISNIKNLLLLHYIIAKRRYVWAFFALALCASLFSSGADDGLASTVYVLGCLAFASSIFSELGNQKQAAQYLTVPASTGEKLVANMLLVNVVYVLCCYFVLSLGLTLGNFIKPIIYSGAVYPIQWQNVYFSSGGDFISELLVLYFFMSIFVFGSIYFRNRPMKTLLWICLVGIACAILAYFTLVVTSKLSLSADLTMWDLEYSVNKYASIELSEAWQIVLVDGSMLLGAVYFYVLSYFRLRETEA